MCGVHNWKHIYVRQVHHRISKDGSVQVREVVGYIVYVTYDTIGEGIFPKRGLDGGNIDSKG